MQPAPTFARSVLVGALVFCAPATSFAEEPSDLGEVIELEVGDDAAGASSEREGEQTELESDETETDLVDVTVVGSKPRRAPGSAHVVSNKKLERFEYDDPHAVLQSVPGVYVRGEDGVGLRPNIGFRGTNPDRSKKVALMEDGIPFAPAPYSAPAAYYFPLMTRMYQVRVSKGPAAIAFGPQTVGGAIDLVTRPIPATGSGGVDLAGGEYGYGKVHAYYGASNETDGFLIEGVHLRDSGFKDLPGGGDTGFYRNEWMFKGSHVFDPTARVRNELSVKLTYSEEASNETYLGLTDADFREDPLQRYAASQLDRMRWHRTAIAVTHELEPQAGLEITTTAYRNDLSRVWRKVNGFRGASLFDVLTNPDSPSNAVYYSILTGRSDSSTPDQTLLVGPNERDFVSQGVQTRVTLDKTTGPLAHRIEYGLRLHYDRVERRHSENGYVLVSGELVPDGEPTVVTAFNEAWTQAVALHALDAITWQALTLSPGVRVELMRSAFVDKATRTETGNSAHVVLPGVGAYFALTDELGVLAGAYRGFSPPPPGQEEQVEPELSVNYEAGARFTDVPARAELIGFYNDYSNLTDVCTQSSGCLDAELDRQYEAGRARIYGLEAFAEHDLEFGAISFPLSGSYTLTFAEFGDSFSSEDPVFGEVEEGDDMPYVPRHQGNASVGVQTEPAGGFVALTYVARMREQAGNEPLGEVLATDEQLTIDMGGRYRPWGTLDLYLNVRNVLGSSDVVSRRPFGARPNAPRWLQIGAKLAF